VKQSEVLPINEFSNMKTTPYAWALFAPTLFPPQLKKDGSFQILGDITTSPSGPLRDRKVKSCDWARWMMWRSDGKVVEHPLFALALKHHITFASSQSQGRIFLNNNGFGSGISLADFQEQVKTEEGRRKIEDVINYAVGNIHGTEQHL
jgi:hypothetical protein